MLILRSWFLFKKYPLITGFIIFLTLTMRIWFFKVVTVHPMLKIYILITRFLNFCLMLMLKQNWVLRQRRQYFWFIFLLDYDHCCIETVKINGSGART